MASPALVRALSCAASDLAMSLATRSASAGSEGAPTAPPSTGGQRSAHQSSGAGVVESDDALAGGGMRAAGGRRVVEPSLRKRTQSPVRVRAWKGVAMTLHSHHSPSYRTSTSVPTGNLALESPLAPPRPPAPPGECCEGAARAAATTHAPARERMRPAGTDSSWSPSS